TPSISQLFFFCLTIGKKFCHLDSSSTSLISHQMPYTPTTGTDEQPQLPLTGPAPQELQHFLRVGAAVPLGLAHGRFLSGRSSDLLHPDSPPGGGWSRTAPPPPTTTAPVIPGPCLCLGGDVEVVASGRDGMW